MVKSRFPGKPGKHFSRRKVPSVVNSDDYEGFRAAQDAYCRLSVFNLLFPDEDEGSSFHGFSPHTDEAGCSQENSEKVKRNKKKKVFCKKRKLQIPPSAEDDTSDALNKNVNTKEKEIEPVFKESPPVKPSPVKEVKEKAAKSKETKLSLHCDIKEDSAVISDSFGTFVLPTRSAHSSRVIKPNKRFIENAIPVMTSKRQRLMPSGETSTQPGNDDTSKKAKSDSSGPNNEKSHSVKCILRKPRLNIKSQPFSTVEGPFSSPTSLSIVQAAEHTKTHPAKVVCGVCGKMKPCKSFRQARKFGIFSCDPCRKFILNIIKKQKEQLLKPLSCDSGTGNCTIRQSALVARPFFTEPEDKEHDRCQGCWLNLCLRSFKLPPGISKRLSVYLPPEVTQRPSGINFENTLTSNWRDVEITVNDNVRSGRLAESLKPTRRKIGKVTPGVRPFKEPDNFKRSKARQKPIPAGPRVKHVCRSASLVLGQQPTSKYVPGSQKNCGGSQVNLEEEIEEKRLPELRDSKDETVIIGSPVEKNLNLPTEIPTVKFQEDEIENIPERPIARMLQDLGRDNCDLLDGIEKHESEKRFAKVSIDFWESYDPDEVSQMGFPLLAYNSIKTKALCFLCGSAGYEKLIHCASCCEPYHTFCVADLRNAKIENEWWKIDWLCPRCCCCEICFKIGGTQLSCTKCFKSYHTNCVPSGRANISDMNWVCPSCLYCKSCNDVSVHVFVGNMPLCKMCFKLRKKGNFCPLCQKCYDDNDYSTKMMECADCKYWIHAKCEGLSNEKYQVLSYLPSSIEFVCRLCCKDPPSIWAIAVDANLKTGYLNVIKSLSKNRLLCTLVKASPKKRLCDCQDTNKKPIHLRNLTGQNDNILGNEKPYLFQNDSPMPTLDDKNSDLGLLTPKLTKDDEESLKTVKSGFLNLVNQKDTIEQKDGVTEFSSREENLKRHICSSIINQQDNSSNLLSIAFTTPKSERDVSNNMNSNEKHLASVEKPEFSEKKCMCQCNIENTSHQTLSLMGIKNKATSDEYSSVVEFNKDMEEVIDDIGKFELTLIYQKTLKQIFPWFDPNESDNLGTSTHDLESVSNNKTRENRKSIDQEIQKKVKMNDSIKSLLVHDQDYYYYGLKIQDTRMCMLCKTIGEGIPTREGRLLYCGLNEWVHANCALWSSEVFEEIDGSLQNVHSAISRARLIRCFECDKKGASVGCCARSCPSAYHFSCALIANCVFLENMEVYCRNHSSLRGNKGCHKEEDFCISRSMYVELDHKKKKDILYNEVKLYVGSLEITNVGEIYPELSDLIDIILPCEYQCSRLYWSSKEPWKVVQYHIKTKLTSSSNEYSIENETNYTLDHSLEFTPPPSPVESDQIKMHNPKVSVKEIKSVISFILDTICSKEEENNLTDHQATDLLPPELKEAIFEDLPHDLLDGISMHDIFTKMNFDDLAELKSEKNDSNQGESSISGNSLRKTNVLDWNKDIKQKANLFKYNTTRAPLDIKKQNTYFKKININNKKDIDRVRVQENYLEREKEYKWKSQSLLQVDGAMDFSESDQSNDSCDVRVQTINIGSQTQSLNNEDEPVKCLRCRRTYRSSVGYERHLSTCSDYLSSSESESSEEEKGSGMLNAFTANQTILEECGTTVNTTLLSNGIHNEQISTRETNFSLVNGITNQNAVPEQVPICTNITFTQESTSSIIENRVTKFKTINNCPIESMDYSLSKPIDQEASYIHNSVVETAKHQPIVGIQNAATSTPAIILQQMPTESVPTYINPYQQQPQTGLQYITAISPQEKTQYLASNQLAPGTYHIQQAPIPTPVVQSVPTMVGTLIQTNGVDQILLNSPNPPLDVYSPQQNNVYIANSPMIVGMETVVSNTVMSSSQFISGSVPGMLAASSYSATTTQVFQATKPVIDVPQSYVVVNTNPPVLNGNTSCMSSIVTNNNGNQNIPWNNYQVNFQESYKMNKNVSYQTVTRQIIHEQKEIDGVKMINSTQETIVIEPLSKQPEPCQIKEIPIDQGIDSNFHHSNINCHYRMPANCNVNENNLIVSSPKLNQVKIVELPHSSTVHKEKPQQAVAPVVVKKVSPSLPVPPPVNGICSQQHFLLNKNKPQPAQVTTKNLLSANNMIKDNSKEKVVVETVIPPETKSKPETVISNLKCSIVSPLPNSTPPKKEIVTSTIKEPLALTQPVEQKLSSLIPTAQTNSVGKDNNLNNAIKRKGNPNKQKIVSESPKITYEITSDDGFSFSTTDIQAAWEKVFETVQKAREAKGLPLLNQNPFPSPHSMLRKMMGLGNNSVKYILEQLPGISGCSKYKPIYHKRKLSALEQEMTKVTKENLSGCARAEKVKHSYHKYDMFSWLASRHRRPPKLLLAENDSLSVISRRAASLNLPMAMRFRHLKETSKIAVGVFRSDIHGRGLFCLRDIESGEMVIEYAGEVIRSALTDKRERFYTSKGIGCYMFRIDDRSVVDATMKGNAARFINHSCEPNCYSRVVDILGKKHILIFALRKILQGEELTYDYKFPLEEDKINCHCLSRRCRKYLN